MDSRAGITSTGWFNRLIDGLLDGSVTVDFEEREDGGKKEGKR